jgi:hypothetical protein
MRNEAAVEKPQAQSNPYSSTFVMVAAADCWLHGITACMRAAIGVCSDSIDCASRKHVVK